MKATTVEQSRRLLAAGLNPESADETCNGLVIGPFWSLAAIWDILHRLDKTYDFGTDMSAEELIEHLVTIICNRFNPKPIENED